MEFFEGWKALNSRFDSDNPTAMTQLIGYKLLAIDNERHHPDEFSVSDRELMKRTGIQGHHTVADARCWLKNVGLIDFTTQKGKPTKYHWTIEGAPRGHLGGIQGAPERDSYIRTRKDVLDVKTKSINRVRKG